MASGKNKRLVRIDEVNDLAEIVKPPRTAIYPIFEFTPEVLKKVTDLAFEYVDDDYDEPDSSLAMGVKDPGAPEEKDLVGEAKNPETFVMYLLGGYTGDIRIRFKGKIGSVSFLGDAIIVDVF